MKHKQQSGFAMKVVLLLVAAVLSVDGAIEGDSCDAKGKPGVCIKISKCSTAVADIGQGDVPLPCGDGKGESVICCRSKADGRVLTTTKRSPVKATTEHIPKEYDYDVVRSSATKDGCKPISDTMTAKKTGQKAWDKCIEYQEHVFPCAKSEALIGGYARKSLCHHNVDELIIGGTPAEKWEFPHMVLLGYKNEQNAIVYQCGGALISEKYILTAGHCISDTRERAAARSAAARPVVNTLSAGNAFALGRELLGTRSAAARPTANVQNEVSHALIGVLKRSHESPINRYGIKRIIKHKKYQSPSKYHDIALLELDRAVVLNHTVVPACLHTGEPVDDSRASVAGWGTTVHNRQVSSDGLQRVVLTKFTSKECSSQYEPMRHLLEGFDEATQICYGDKTKSVDACKGDSGGSLQVKSQKISCMYTIIGVTSFGQECGLPGTAGIYTRVSHYLPWIESIVWP